MGENVDAVFAEISRQERKAIRQELRRDLEFRWLELPEERVVFHWLSRSICESNRLLPFSV